MKVSETSVRGPKDLRDLPAYNYAEASRALRVPAPTLRAWTRGQTGFALVFSPASIDKLSYFNLIEAGILRAIREVHKIPMKVVRKALVTAADEHGIERLLIHRDLRFGCKDLFLEKLNNLVSLTRGEQLVLRMVFDAYLSRVEYGQDDRPIQFFPLLHGYEDPGKPVAISPFVSFGRATLRGTGISTQSIASRYNAGESVGEIAADHEIEGRSVEEAIYYEAA